MATGYATGPGAALTDAAGTANKTLLDPNLMLNPQNIPGFQASQDAMMQSLTRNLTENQLPQVRNEASMTGGYGGSKQGIAEGLAVGRTNDAIAQALANMNVGAYGQGLNAMQGAIGLAPSTYATGTAPATTVGQVGAAQRADQAGEVMAGREQFAEQQAAAPANTLDLLRQLMGVQGQYGGTTSGVQTGAQTGATAQTGTQSSTQLAQQLSQLLGISEADLTGTSTGTASGTSSGQGTSTTTNKPSTLQQLAGLASIFMMPFSMGLGSAQGAAAGGG